MYCTGLGATLKSSAKQLRIESERLAMARRTTEAEAAAKAAAEDTAVLQEKVVTWAPRIIVGVAVLIGGYLLLKKMRSKGR